MRPPPNTILFQEWDFLDGREYIHNVYPNGDLKGYSEKRRDCDNPFRDDWIRLNGLANVFFPFASRLQDRFVAKRLLKRVQDVVAPGRWGAAHAAVIFGLHFATSSDQKTAQLGVAMVAEGILDQYGFNRAREFLFKAKLRQGEIIVSPSDRLNLEAAGSLAEVFEQLGNVDHDMRTDAWAVGRRIRDDIKRASRTPGVPKDPTGESGLDRPLSR